MAPELIKRLRTDHRIDVFSYAVTCYEMWAKQLPWEAVETMDAVRKHINQPPKKLRELVPGIDEEVAEVIMRGLQSHPDNRWASVEQMLVRLRNAKERLARLRG
jgi:serine/threonine protein kinase